ncbi:hypothetical protein ACN38_g4735 [Penicillium nordicum]|uniref:Uncharacterized protein n=1 Tax=Penicillium nordicum TaxID=229535 RepID=A0A0M8PA38_9EURO|nr:hypothetical protein ACN38_g4735 [Penicillium nordicum]
MEAAILPYILPPYGKKYCILIRKYRIFLPGYCVDTLLFIYLPVRAFIFDHVLDHVLIASPSPLELTKKVVKKG